MGMSSGKDRRGLVSEINVTPMVDVMLVLLIIFMVTAPMMTQGLEVDLPETTARSLRQKEEPLVVTLDKDYANNKEQPVFLKADKQVPYGLVISIMAEIKAAGFDKLGMITQAKEEPR